MYVQLECSCRLVVAADQYLAPARLYSAASASRTQCGVWWEVQSGVNGPVAMASRVADAALLAARRYWNMAAAGIAAARSCSNFRLFNILFVVIGAAKGKLAIAMVPAVVGARNHSGGWVISLAPLLNFVMKARRAGRVDFS